MSPVVGPQSVPSQVSVVLVEETEVRCAERWASVPADKDVRLLAVVACPAGVTVCEECVVMPGTVGTLSPSDSDSVGHDGPDGTLSPSDSDSVGHDDAVLIRSHQNAASGRSCWDDVPSRP